MLAQLELRSDETIQSLNRTGPHMTNYDPEQVLPKMIHMKAESGGHDGRTVRLNGGKVPLATCTYNFSQRNETKSDLAERIATLWNLSKGLSLGDLQALEKADITIMKLLEMVQKKHPD